MGTQSIPMQGLGNKGPLEKIALVSSTAAAAVVVVRGLGTHVKRTPEIVIAISSSSS